MRASKGDRLMVHSRHVGEPDRAGEILEVRGEDGAPPYLVHWEDGHDSVFFPSSDTVAEHHPAAPRTD